MPTDPELGDVDPTVNSGFLGSLYGGLSADRAVVAASGGAAFGALGLWFLSRKRQERARGILLVLPWVGAMLLPAALSAWSKRSTGGGGLSGVRGLGTVYMRPSLRGGGGVAGQRGTGRVYMRPAAGTVVGGR